MNTFYSSAVEKPNGSSANLRAVQKESNHFLYLKRVSSRDLKENDVFKLRYSNTPYRVILLTTSLAHAFTQDGTERWIKLPRSEHFAPHFVYMVESGAAAVLPVMSVVTDADMMESIRAENNTMELHNRYNFLNKIRPVFLGGTTRFSDTGEEINFLSL